MKRVATRAVAVLAVLAACRADRSPDDKPPVGETASGGRAKHLPNPSGPVKADALIKQAATERKDLMLSRIAAKYVRADGTMDATYGELELNLIGAEPPPPPDDPNRPTGAPVRQPDPAADRGPDCEDFRWSATTGWAPRQDEYMKMCLALGERVPVRCTVIQIWQRALADGAPDNALAKIDVIAGMGWTLSIDDDPRNVHFSRTYDDDCTPAAEAGP